MTNEYDGTYHPVPGTTDMSRRYNKTLKSWEYMMRITVFEYVTDVQALTAEYDLPKELRKVMLHKIKDAVDKKVEEL